MSNRTSKYVASLAAAAVVGVLAVSPALAGQTPVDEEYEDAIAGETSSGSQGTLGAESTFVDTPALTVRPFPSTKSPYKVER